KVDAERGTPILIDLPPVSIPRFVLPPDFSKRVAEITQMSRDYSAKSASMTSAQRDEAQRKIREKSKELDSAMNAAREEFHQNTDEARQRQAELVLERQEQLADAQRQRAENQAERERARIERERTRIETGRQHAAKTATAAPSAKAATAATPAPAVAATPAPQVRVRRQLTVAEKQRLNANEKQTSLLFGRHFDVSLSNGGEVVGQIRAKLSTSEIVKRILGSSENRDEVPFALDREGNLYTRNDNDRATLERLGIADALKRHKAFGEVEGWIIAVSEDKESGLRVGAARPVGENLQELRKTAARNFGYGMGLIAFALIGIVPLANHLTRDVKMVSDGASRIAQGDLQTRLPVHSKNEFGQLAVAFNQMAEDLSRNQQQIYEQERARREQEVQQRVLSLEYERKSVDLEDARRFQLSMLPKEVPQHDRFDVGVFTQTATEVGGDYYDFHLDSDRGLSVTIGDATGHGAKAGTMVTVIKTLFSGYDSTVPPSDFLRDAAEKIKRMELGRMAMALALARFTNDSLTIASAGMPPLLVHRRGMAVEEIELPATPLGTLGVEYEQRLVSLSAGDTILLMTDGFPELQNASGQQLGYVAAMKEFETAAAASNAQGVIKGLADAVRRWHGDLPPNDDITFVVVRCRA
ncbi:MAG: SpoIIE family protein phosphatase, partial [Thermoanaerobaculia bacterium]